MSFFHFHSSLIRSFSPLVDERFPTTKFTNGNVLTEERAAVEVPVQTGILLLAAFQVCEIFWGGQGDRLGYSFSEVKTTNIKNDTAALLLVRPK